jgi:hypothetical protein
MRSSTFRDVPGTRRYDELRTSIHNGDVLLYRGRTFFSRVIQWATRSRYSHAGLATWWNDRLMVMEAVGKGVIVTALSKNIRSYHGDVELFAFTGELSQADRMSMIRFAQQELGKAYGRWNAIKLGLRLLFKRGIEARDALRREQRLFCSHYVAETYNAVGKDLKKGASDRFMSPGDLAMTPLLHRVAILKTARGR